jgi:hypothetical protein
VWERVTGRDALIALKVYRTLLALANGEAEVYATVDELSQRCGVASACPYFIQRSGLN